MMGKRGRNTMRENEKDIGVEREMMYFGKNTTRQEHE